MRSNQAQNKPSNGATKASAQQAKRSTSSFPWVLHDMLEIAEEAGYENIVSWQPHGRSFLVHKPDEFVTKILPIFFNSTKYKSFQRQLSLYGFRRMHAGMDRGAYFHHNLVRGDSSTCKSITRNKAEQEIPIEEPNFYTEAWAPKCTNKNARRCFSPAQIKEIAKFLATASGQGQELNLQIEPTPLAIPGSFTVGQASTSHTRFSVTADHAKLNEILSTSNTNHLQQQHVLPKVISGDLSPLLAPVVAGSHTPLRPIPILPTVSSSDLGLLQVPGLPRPHDDCDDSHADNLIIEGFDDMSDLFLIGDDLQQFDGTLEGIFI